MSSMDETIKAMDELINSDGTIELPGLSLDEVVENFVETKYGEELKAVSTKEEREKLREKWIKYYKEGEGKQAIQMEINNIKAQYGAAKDQLTYVADAAVSAVASNAIPSVITVGSASSSPNPAYTIIENKTKKNQLLAMLKQIGASLVSLLKSAVSIAFAVPETVITLIKTLTTVKKTVNSIPA
jgi:hypothetical protein